MMTQPIRYFLDLTSEPTSAAPMKAPKLALSYEERRMLEMRARYARAELAAGFVADAILWVSRKTKAAVAWVKADMKLRHAESQLFRMSDRELSDLGLCRSDIHFAVREAAEGVVPAFDHVTGQTTPANQNMRRAA